MLPTVGHDPASSACVVLPSGTAGDYVPMNKRLSCVVATVAALLSGCAAPAPPAAGPASTAPQTAVRGEVTGSGTVLQKGEHPPVFCLGAIDSIYPPQGCGGPLLRNWDWSSVTGYESAAGVRWGSYTLTGTWDHGEFVRTREPVRSRQPRQPSLTLHGPSRESREPGTRHGSCRFNMIFNPQGASPSSYQGSRMATW